VHRHAKEQLVGDFTAIGEPGHLANGVEFAHQLAGKRRKLPSFCADAFRGYPGAPVEVPLVLVQRIVFGAIRYARGLGFEPHADFAKAAGHLGEWDGVCDLEFGRDGMPRYIEGPHDDRWRIMHTLRQNVGDGNFHYLVGLRP
jgi:hypothetical protein